MEKITYPIVYIQCDICHTWYKSKVLYNAHKLLDDHIKRKREINDLLLVAYECTDIKKHVAIKKIPKIDTHTISKSLKYQKNRKYKT